MKKNNIRKIILNKVKSQGSLKVSEVMEVTGFSREYINRFLRELRDEGKILLIGKSNQAQYILAEKGKFLAKKRQIL